MPALKKMNRFSLFLVVVLFSMIGCSKLEDISAKTEQCSYYSELSSKRPSVIPDVIKVCTSVIEDKNSNILDVAVALDARALVHMSTQNNADALKDANRAIELSGGFYRMLSTRSSILIAMGEFERSLADLDRIIDQNPTYWIAYSNRGYVHCKLRNKSLSVSDGVLAARYHPRGYRFFKEALKSLGYYDGPINDTLDASYKRAGNKFYEDGCPVN